MEAVPLSTGRRMGIQASEPLPVGYLRGHPCQALYGYQLLHKLSRRIMGA